MNQACSLPQRWGLGGKQRFSKRLNHITLTTHRRDLPLSVRCICHYCHRHCHPKMSQKLVIIILTLLSLQKWQSFMRSQISQLTVAIFYFVASKEGSMWQGCPIRCGALWKTVAGGAHQAPGHPSRPFFCPKNCSNVKMGPRTISILFSKDISCQYNEYCRNYVKMLPVALVANI